VSVERETFPGLLASGAQVRGVVDSGYWLDLGTPLAFVQGSKDLVLGHAPSPAVLTPGAALVLDGAQIADSARIDGGSSIGRNAVVTADAHVSGSVVFDDAVIGAGARVVGSIVGAGARIGDGCELHGVVVGDGAVIGARNELRDGARVWPGIELPETSIRYSTDA
jgi:mannose-1-phosphate guanylyltransferase